MKTKDQRMSDENSLFNANLQILLTAIEEKLDQEYQGEEIFVYTAWLESLINGPLTQKLIDSIVSKYRELGYETHYEPEDQQGEGSWIIVK